ncbi:helix-turn-helix domain-containing protein [Nocardia vulneris]|uniref:helix-turn-helix domain-containing protein n=1 Tax=Nocardia vulneris TaxID=1141657 RepID=UPI000A75A68D|nr:helix-turn-helix domain-containing protein [Nocardia vulneris]
MSFHQWRTLLRVQYALVHLVHGHSVTEIAVRCGWSNPTSFIEAFTAIIGQTPGPLSGRSAAPAGDQRAHALAAHEAGSVVHRARSQSLLRLPL